MAVIALDLRHVSLFLLGNDIDPRGKGVAIMTLSPSSAVLGTVFLGVGEGSLLSRRWLFSTRCVSKGRVGGLILSGVPLLLLCGPIFPRISWVYIAGAERWLEHHLCLRINGFLYGLFPGVQGLASSIHLDPDRRFQVFQKTSDHDLLVWSCNRIRLSENHLQVIQMGSPVKDFLLLMLGFPFKLSSIGVYKGLWVT